ncbi:YoaK family protein [Oxalobacteraceae bacterium A2-2]
MQRGDTRQAVGLGFLAGYVDTLVFVGLFGLFTAHVTGNFVLIGRALISPSHEILIKLLVFPVFILFVAITRLLILWWDRRGWPALRCGLLLQLLLMLATVACAHAARPMVVDAPLSLLTGMLAAGAMAVQNAYNKLLMGKAAATTVMTGNVTQLVIDLVDSFRGDPAALGRCKVLFWPVVAFALGCISGAYAYVAFQFNGLLLACAVLLWLALTASD